MIQKEDDHGKWQHLYLGTYKQNLESFHVLSEGVASINFKEMFTSWLKKKWHLRQG